MKPWPTFESYIKWMEEKGSLLQRLFFLFALLLLLFRFFSHVLIYQMGRVPLLYQEIDPVYWLFMILKIPDLIASKTPVLFDSLLIGSCLCSVIWTRQNIATLIFFVAYFIFFVLNNLMSGHHYISIGILFVSFPFVFRQQQNRALAMMFIRFLFCFMMFSAGVWKIVRGNLVFPDQIYTQLVSRHLTDILEHHASLRMTLIEWLIQHKSVAHLFWVSMIGIETIFVIGFFSLRYDRYLMVGYLLFAIGGWFLLRLLIYENFAFLLTMAPALSLRKFRRENELKVD